MLRLLSQYSRGRIAWLLLLLSAVAFEGTALYFQHVLLLAPCVLCIYQRCAIFGVLLASLVGLISPKNLVLRLIAIALWLYSSVEGFLIAYRHANLQFNPSLFDSCPVFAEFPSWLPLDQWFPSIFEPYGLCSEKIWSFLTIEMSQWMIIIFAAYFIVGAIVLFAQLFQPRKLSIWDKQ